MNNEEPLNIKEYFAALGRKSMKLQWDEKYPKGSPEREKRTAHMKELWKRRKKGGEKTP